MATIVSSAPSQFAYDVDQGLSGAGQKWLSARYFYDEIGSALFEVITLLPEYGLTRADEKLLRTHAPEIARAAQGVTVVAELGSGSGRKTTHVLRALSHHSGAITYRPIDVSQAALQACQRELAAFAEVQPVLGDWMDGLAEAASARTGDAPMLLLFLGSSVGNLERKELVPFLQRLRSYLQPGDFFLLGADLVKNVDVMIRAYDDPTGVTAAFNLNVLARINRELDGDFDLRSFVHEVRWNSEERRIEMHLLSCRDQDVFVRELGHELHFCAGDTIWTESSHKFTEPELDGLAMQSGFSPVAMWTDAEWPFAEALWLAQ